MHWLVWNKFAILPQIQGILVRTQSTQIKYCAILSAQSETRNLGLNSGIDIGISSRDGL